MKMEKPMNFEEELRLRTDNVQKIIEKYLPKAEGFQKTVLEAMNYSMLAGGKRLRPILMQETYRMFGGKREVIEPFMAAMEMIHTHSLIHDDLPAMDNDDFRRGKPSCHKAFGEAMAILAGDALSVLPFEIIADDTALDAQSKVRIFSELTKAVGRNGMIGGQVMDLESENKEIGLASLEKLQSLKTGELIRCAALLGCLSGNAPETLNRAAESYADGIGRAFQVIDDILDVTGDEKTLGKPTGSDAASGKNTFATLMTIGEAREYAASVTSDAVSAIKGFDGSEQLSSLAGWLLERKK